MVTDEQKRARKDEIVSVFISQYSRKPMAQITMTTIAQELGCNRANLVPYYPTIMAIIADAWARKVSEFCDGLIADLNAEESLDVDKYVDIVYRNYFVKSDVLRYFAVQATLVENPEVKEIVLTHMGRHAHHTALHQELLSQKLGISMIKAEIILETIHFMALGLHNSETVSVRLMPNVSDKAEEYVRRRYLRMTKNMVEMVIQESERFNNIS